MPYRINHIHLKAYDPATAAAWWCEAFGFNVVSDMQRPQGDRFIVCETAEGTRIAISGERTGERLTPGDAGVREGLEHFGLDSDDIDADVARLTARGAELLEGPEDGPVFRIVWLRCPGNVRLELMQRRDA
jgi:catechol 2,3-dioxygenase-like lactoylglutathione lyase family enzyme